MTGAPWQKRNRPFPEKIEFLLSNNTHLQRPKSARHWSDQDTEVDTDTPVVRHNRLEEVIFVYAAMMFVLLSSLYQVRRASIPRLIDLIRKWERTTVR